MPFDSAVKQVVVVWFFAAAFVGLGAQARGQAQASGTSTPNVAESAIQLPLVNYFALGSVAKTEFQPTTLTPNARGTAQIAITKDGSVSVKAQFNGLDGPTRFGNEYLNYVLWAVTPKGQPYKIGELSLSGDRAQLVATTALRTFGMLVTAEPYYSVTRPGNVVVLTGKSMGAADPPFAACELLQGGYGPAGYKYEPIDTSSGYPPELVQALNARRIAKQVQADKYAQPSYRSAEDLYEYMMGWAIKEKKPSKKLVQLASSVAGSYEVARSQSLRRQSP